MLQKIMTVTAISLLLASTATANEVYIEQAGSSSTIDITQTGDGNRVGSSTEATTIQGSTSDIDITQTGTGNEIDIETGISASTSTVDIVQDGSNNIADIDIGSADSTVLNLNIDGDSNETTLCGTLGTTAGVGQSAACGTEMVQDDFGVDVDIVGDSNKVAIARDGLGGTASTTEVTVNIGSTVASSNNIVNIEQLSTTESGVVSLTMDGSSNVVNITQQ